MKTVFALIALSLGFTVSALAAPVSTCYDMRITLPKDLDGSGVRQFPKSVYKICFREDNVVQNSLTKLYSGTFRTSIIDGSFLLKAYSGLTTKKVVSSMTNETIIYGATATAINTNETAKIVRVSLDRTAAPGAGSYRGQVSIGGFVYGLYGL